MSDATETCTECRTRFVELACDIAAELALTPPEGLDLARSEHDPHLCLQLQIGPWAVRLLHCIQPVELARTATVEIVLGEPAPGKASALHAELLAMNAASWPAGYALDAQSGHVVYGWPVALTPLEALQGTEVAEGLAQEIAAAILEFHEWRHEGLIHHKKEIR
jgi:hypothetical protein